MKMMTVYVADASVFMYGLRFVGTVYTVPRVLSEVRSSDAEVVLQAFISEGLRIEEPLQKDVDAVTEKAKSTGDYVKLSQADIDLLAKSREVNGTLVTDDYSVQNVAACLGIETQQIRQAGIKRALSWRRRCVGCGRLYDEQTICPVCGSEVKLKPAKR